MLPSLHRIQRSYRALQYAIFGTAIAVDKDIRSIAERNTKLTFGRWMQSSRRREHSGSFHTVVSTSTSKRLRTTILLRNVQRLEI